MSRIGVLVSTDASENRKKEKSMIIPHQICRITPVTNVRERRVWRKGKEGN